MGGYSADSPNYRLLAAWPAWVLSLVLVFLGHRAHATPQTVSVSGEPAPTGETWPPLRELAHLEFAGLWEYNFGDSPKDSLGRLLWALPQSPSRDWTPIGRYDKLTGRKDRRWLWLRAEIPPHNHPDPVFYMLHLDQELQVFLDGKLIYEWGDFSIDNRPFRGFRGHMIRLPKDSSGRRLCLRIYSAHRNIGPAGPMRFGDRGDIMLHLFLNDLPRVIVGGILFLLSAMGFALYWLRRDEAVFLAYGVLALAGGLYILAQAQQRLFLYDSPVVVTHVELWTLQIAALALSHFVELMFGQGPGRVLYYLRQLQWAYLLGSAICVATGVVPLLGTLFPVQIMLLFDAVLAVGLPSYYALRGNVEARIFAIGFLFAGSIAVYDVLVALGLLSRAKAKLGHIGYVLFFLTLAVILARRVLRAHERLKSYTFVLNLSLASSRVLVPDERAQVALAELCRLLSARRAFLFLKNEQTGALEFASGRSGQQEGLVSAEGVDAGLVKHVHAHQKPLVRRSRDRKSALLVAPLTVRGQQIGVLYIESDVRQKGLHEEDLDVLTGLAHQVAISIVSARTLRMEMDAALTQKRMQEQQVLLDAALRMAAGDLSTPVEVPPGSAVSHLAVALKPCAPTF